MPPHLTADPPLSRRLQLVTDRPAWWGDLRTTLHETERWVVVTDARWADARHPAPPDVVLIDVPDPRPRDARRSAPHAFIICIVDDRGDAVRLLDDGADDVIPARLGWPFIATRIDRVRRRHHAPLDGTARTPRATVGERP